MLLARVARAGPRRVAFAAGAAAFGVGAAVTDVSRGKARRDEADSRKPSALWGVEAMQQRARQQAMELGLLRVAHCDGASAAGLDNDDDDGEYEDDEDDDDDGASGFFARNSVVLITTGAVITTCVSSDMPMMQCICGLT
jgi:hypothetical protein